VCIYIYIYIYIYICVHTHRGIYICIFVHGMYVCIYTPMFSSAEILCEVVALLPLQHSICANIGFEHRDDRVTRLGRAPIDAHEQENVHEHESDGGDVHNGP
jgi:hypothetical protein